MRGVLRDPWVQMLGFIAVCSGALTLQRGLGAAPRAPEPHPQQTQTLAPLAAAAAAPLAANFPAPQPAAAPAPAPAAKPKLRPKIPGRWIVDAAMGSGADAASLAEALAAAEEGDELRLRPGRYGAGAALAMDLSLVGEPKEGAAVVIEARGREGLRVEKGRVKLSGLTFTGSRSDSVGLAAAEQAVVTLEASRFVGLKRGVVVDGADASVSLSGVALSGCATGVEARGGGKISLLDVAIEDSDVGVSALEGASLQLAKARFSRVGEGVALLGGKTRGKLSLLKAVGGRVGLSAQSGARVEGENVEFSGQSECAVKASDPGTRVALEQGRFADARRGICGSDGAEIALSHASLVDSGENAVALEGGAAGTLARSSVLRAGQTAVVLAGRSKLLVRDSHFTRSSGEAFILKEGSSLEGDKLVAADNTSCAVMIEDAGTVVLRNSKLNGNLCGIALYRGGSLNLSDCDLTRNKNGHLLYKQQHRGEIQITGSRNIPSL